MSTNTAILERKGSNELAYLPEKKGLADAIYIDPKLKVLKGKIFKLFILNGAGGFVDSIAPQAIVYRKVLSQFVVKPEIVEEVIALFLPVLIYKNEFDKFHVVSVELLESKLYAAEFLLKCPYGLLYINTIGEVLHLIGKRPQDAMKDLVHEQFLHSRQLERIIEIITDVKLLDPDYFLSNFARMMHQNYGKGPKKVLPSPPKLLDGSKGTFESVQFESKLIDEKRRQELMTIILFGEKPELRIPSVEPLSSEPSDKPTMAMLVSKLLRDKERGQAAKLQTTGAANGTKGCNSSGTHRKRSFP